MKEKFRNYVVNNITKILAVACGGLMVAQTIVFGKTMYDAGKCEGYDEGHENGYKKGYDLGEMKTLSKIQDPDFWDNPDQN